VPIVELFLQLDFKSVDLMMYMIQRLGRNGMAKVDPFLRGPNGELITYGLNGECCKNYIKYGRYVYDYELLPIPLRWLLRLFN
jgi:hypothetical protein